MPNPMKKILFAPSFIRSFSLLAGATVHFLCFVAVLVDKIYVLLPNPVFWLWFFSAYTVFALFVMGLGINQMIHFAQNVDEIIAEEKKYEGYETINHSVE